MSNLKFYPIKIKRHNVLIVMPNGNHQGLERYMHLRVKAPLSSSDPWLSAATVVGQAAELLLNQAQLYPTTVVIPTP